MLEALVWTIIIYYIAYIIYSIIFAVKEYNEDL